MLVVTVELHDANTGEVRPLRKIIISNDGTGSKMLGSYDVRMGYKEDGIMETWKLPERMGKLTNYPRRFDNVWRLVFRALKSVLPEERS